MWRNNLTKEWYFLWYLSTGQESFTWMKSALSFLLSPRALPILPFYFLPCLSQCHGISAAVEWNTPTSHSSSLCGTLDCLHASPCVNKPCFNIECGCETCLISCESLMSDQGNAFCMVFMSTTYLKLKNNQQTIISFTSFRKSINNIYANISNLSLK